jgi:hypothetical protein
MRSSGVKLSWWLFLARRKIASWASKNALNDTLAILKSASSKRVTIATISEYCAVDRNVSYQDLCDVKLPRYG